MDGVKERPILFSAPMIRALLAGTKTQTRRALKVQPLDVLSMKGDKAGVEWVGLMQRDPEPKGTVFRCKFGKPGDLLYVRETWGACSHFDNTAPRDLPHFAAIKYFADGAIVGATAGYGLINKSRPSIHMPRWASRITLEITSVRIERLGEISRDDAEAEGLGLRRVSENDHRWIDYTDKDCVRTFGDPRFSFWSLWESINGADSRAANPYVWVIEFRRVAANA